MKQTNVFPILFSLQIILLLSFLGKASYVTTRGEIVESPTKIIETTKSIETITKVEPNIFFEKTVCDLGEVGQGTKNECEFRFTNTGRGLLKIDKISRTCGCTVFGLDKKQYPPNETGVIKVI